VTALVVELAVESDRHGSSATRVPRPSLDDVSFSE